MMTENKKPNYIPEQELRIIRAENGWILYWEEYTDEGIVMMREVIAEDDLELMSMEKESMTRLLYRIAEYFGQLQDKYSKNNLNITWDKRGSRVE
jgi:hypothetical protein